MNDPGRRKRRPVFPWLKERRVYDIMNAKTDTECADEDNTGGGRRHFP